MNENRDIKIITGKSNKLTISVSKIFLHSKYDPEGEAKKFIDAQYEAYAGQKKILIYGMGFGYHVRELLRRINADTEVFIFDLDEDVIREAYKNGLINDIVSDSRVRFYDYSSQNFMAVLSSIISSAESIIIYKPSLKVLSNEYEALKTALNNFEISKIAVEKFGTKLSENYEKNNKSPHMYINEFFSKYNFEGETIIIVSSGPSLNTCFEALKVLQHKFKIFAAGSALKPLLAYGIKPFMFSMIEAQDMVCSQIDGVEDNIPMCYLSTTSNETVNKYPGEKYMFFNEENDTGVAIDTGKSVATANLSIAIYGKAKNIIFVGQDLAFYNGEQHCSNYPHPLGLVKINENGGLYKYVMGVNNSMLPTNDGLLYFKHWIETTISNHKDINFYNCSMGARIEGTVEVNVENILDVIS